MILVLVLAVLLVAMLARWVSRAYAEVGADDVQAMNVVSGVRPSPAGDTLFAAFLSRGRRYRTSWSMAAVMVSIALAVMLGGTRVTLGPNPHQPYADVLLMGIGGYLLGAVLAELHHLRRHDRGARTASIAPRRLNDYAPTWLRWLPRGALAFTAVAFAAGAATRGFQLHDPRMELTVLVGVAAIVWALVESAVSAVVRRPRPALPDSLTAADDAVRAASARSLLLGGAGAEGLVAATMFAAVGESLNQGSALVLPIAIASIVAFGASIILALRARRVVWPARGMRAERAAA